ncbi:MAG: helix-turn-helix transcriptional regulator [Planctomycetes bacterium]|nr:helix-turn-helix transcriptional regulator [Planctomycetota bacterium]
MSKRNKKTLDFLDDLAGGPLTFGDAVRAARELTEISQAELARRLGVGRQSVCDIEKGRALVSVEKAAKFAKALGHNEKVFVRLALQDQVVKAGLKLKISVNDAA